MEKTLVPGKTYTVTTASECSVTDSNGLVLCTAAAGEQKAFVATTPTIIFSDDSATVTAVFKCALAKLKALGVFGGGKTQSADYLPALFLEGRQGRYIDTETTLNGDSVVSFTYQPVNLGTVNENGCIFGARESSTLRVFTYYDRWNYNSVHVYFGYNNGSTMVAQALRSETVTHVEIDGPSWRAVNTTRTLSREFAQGDFETYTAYLFSLHIKSGADPRGFEGRIFTVTIGQPNEKQRDFVSALDKNGVPCMYDLVTKQPFYNSGTGAFIVGMTAEQAAKLSKLPSTGGSLTISLPAEIVDSEGNVTDSAVDAAITTAKNNGWTITIQTYTEA